MFCLLKECKKAYAQILSDFANVHIFNGKKITAAAEVATRRDFKDIFLRLHVQKQLHLVSYAHFNIGAGHFPQLVFG